ncbi:MAG: substrate-binding domain-containing protein, partial [Planctomycetota bacterium]
MRHHGIARILIALSLLWANPVSALELEAEEYFPSANIGMELRIVSTADLQIFTPIIIKFQQENPDISVRYMVASSRDIFDAVYTNTAQFDLVISSAMDLQTKLVNDAFAQPYRSSHVAALPDWARWRSEIFAFAREPAVLLLSKSAMSGLPTPQSRSELIQVLRENPERFRGRIGTYDIRSSGLG